MMRKIIIQNSVVVSHDRIYAHLFVFEGDSVAKMYIGDGSECETMMQEKFGKDLPPHRVKYRILKQSCYRHCKKERWLSSERSERTLA